MPSLGKNVLDISPDQKDHVHGRHPKDMVVLHETVSPDYKGWADIKQTSEFLGTEDYGIHGIVDLEGHMAWAKGLGNAIFYHTKSSGSKGNGNVNSRAIGIEQVSRVMLDYKSRADQRKAWLHRTAELNAAAKLIAAAKRAGFKIPLVTSDGSKPGITTHYLVTMRFGVSGGHTDCWPVNDGGYYPLSQVVALARHYYIAGTRL